MHHRPYISDILSRYLDRPEAQSLYEELHEYLNAVDDASKSYGNVQLFSVYEPDQTGWLQEEIRGLQEELQEYQNACGEIRKALSGL